MITAESLRVRGYRLEKERVEAERALYRIEGALIFLDELTSLLEKERVAADPGVDRYAERSEESVQ